MKEIDDYLAGLIVFLEADEKVKVARIAFEKRMESIDHNTSSEQDYRAKLEWLSAQGKDGEMKRLMEMRRV